MCTIITIIEPANCQRNISGFEFMCVRWFQYILSNVPYLYMRLRRARYNAWVIWAPQRRSNGFKATWQLHYGFVHVFDPYSNHPVQKSKYNIWIYDLLSPSVLPIATAGEKDFRTPRRKFHGSHTATMYLHDAGILMRIESWTLMQTTLVSAHEKCVGLERMNLQYYGLWVSICLQQFGSFWYLQAFDGTFDTIQFYLTKSN